MTTPTGRATATPPAATPTTVAPPLSATGTAVDNASVGDLMANVSRDLSTLMRQEVELAKAEAKESATRAGKGAGMFAGAGIAGHFVLLFLSIALWWGIGDATGHGISALIVAAIWAVIAAILALVGRTEMKTVKGMPRTADSVKKIPPALKGDA
jgi:hypothetical protein